jgi:hypothetical protein
LGSDENSLWETGGPHNEAKDGDMERLYYSSEPLVICDAPIVAM